MNLLEYLTRNVCFSTAAPAIRVTLPPVVTVLCAFILLAPMSSVRAALPPALKPYAEKFDADRAALTIAGDVQLKPVRERYLAALAAAEKVATAAAKTGDLAAIAAEMRAVALGALPDALPPDLPRSLAQDRRAYVTAAASIAHTIPPRQRDVAKPDDLRKVYDPFYKIMCDQVRRLNDQYQSPEKRQVVYVVPVAYAVIALREKVAERKAPGIARQSELFRDDRGHGKPAIYLLATYCNYAIIYGRSPVGLPAPASPKKDVKAEDVEPLNRLLQEIAWETVTSHPLAGVKKERPVHQP